MTDKWDRRFLELARHIAAWSKDPSTKVGAVIVDRDGRIVSTGYNGFPRGVVDWEERLANRDVRLKMTCHSERNAIVFARQSLKDCVLYTTLMPCASCAGVIIQAGITEVVTAETPPALAQRWLADFMLTKEMFAEAGVTLRTVSA